MRFAFLTLGILLIIAWVCAFVLFHVVGAMIHLLLVFAVIAFIIHLVSRPRSA